MFLSPAPVEKEVAGVKKIYDAHKSFIHGKGTHVLTFTLRSILFGSSNEEQNKKNVPYR